MQTKFSFSEFDRLYVQDQPIIIILMRRTDDKAESYETLLILS